MTGKLDVAAINYGTTDEGRRTAVVTFKYTDDEGPFPAPDHFEVEVWTWDVGDHTANVDSAKRAFHRLARDLAASTAEWDRE